LKCGPFRRGVLTQFPIFSQGFLKTGALRGDHKPFNTGM
jgi:hypothetical protein